jgi:hypothetical protein
MEDDLERIVSTHSQVRRLTNEQLRDQVNVAFAARDYRRSWALHVVTGPRPTRR